MLAKKAGIPTVIAHSHSSSFGKSGAIMKRKSRIARFLFAKYCDYLFADSKKAGEFMFNRDDVEVIRMGIDSKKYVFDNAVRKTIKQKLGINESTTVLGHVGRFAYAKNHKFLIEIFDEYQKINPNSVLVLVGEGDLCEEIRKKVEILGLQKSVIFYGFTDKVYEIMQAMDIFVLPSHSEGLGIVAIEAQASGMPIVVSTAVPREAVLLCNAHTIELSLPAKDWAMKIQQVLNTEKRIPTSQQTIIDAGFDIQTVTEHLQEIYSS